MVPGFFALNCLRDVGRQIRIAFTGPHAAIEVMFDLGEKAGADLAVGGEADPAASSAKGLGDGGDDADFSNAVSKCVAAGGFAGFAGRERCQRQDAMNAPYDFSERHNNLRRPEAAFFKRHEFDEAYHDIFFAGEARKAFNLAIVKAA